MVVRKRLKISGPALVFITTTVTDWLPIFEKEQAALIAINQLKETAEFYGVSVIGYVLMPSYLHALLGFSDISELSKFVQGFKSLTSRKLKRNYLGQFKTKLNAGGKFRLWKQRFDDIIITSQEQFEIKLDYIHHNPVKAGLAKNAIDWKYSSASDWLDGNPGLIEIDKDYKWMQD